MTFFLLNFADAFRHKSVASEYYVRRRKMFGRIKTEMVIMIFFVLKLD